MYLITDVKTGNMLSGDSIIHIEDTIVCSSYTGEAEGIEYYYKKEKATETLHNLQAKLDTLDINKVLEIIEKDRNMIPEGEIIKEYFVRNN